MKRHLLAARWPAAVALACLAVTIPVTTLARADTGSASYARHAGAVPPACAVPASAGPPQVSPTTVTTIEQAYYCVFSHYYSRPVLDDRVLLAGAFAGLTQELDRLGLDTDRNCASACDAFAGAIKDLRLGTLIGTRTAGIVAGPANVYELDDGSLLSLPSLHELGADREIINGIGVAPGYYVPLTAADLSAGRDPGIAKALTLLGQ